MRTSATYLKTLRRIPDDVFLSIFAHDFDEGNPDRCICGWALREGFARISNVDPESVDRLETVPPVRDMAGTPGRCAAMFGGQGIEWETLFCGADSWFTPLVEEAVVDRLNEIVRA